MFPPKSSTPPRRGIPQLGMPYRVSRVTVIIEIVCQQCERESTVTLINTQESKCPGCGAPYDCGGIQWDVTGQHDAAPKVAISAGAPTRRIN